MVSDRYLDNRRITPGRAGFRLPPWIRTSVSGGPQWAEVRGVLKSLKLNSVCESARCPNLSECWNRRTATFMIMGNICTRNCAFCAVHHGRPGALDEDEGRRIAEAAVRLQLQYLVLTSVTRDDLADGGASHISGVIKTVRQRRPNSRIEILAPDFRGSAESLYTVLEAAPEVFNHNIETCQRLTRKMRDVASYERSLQVLGRAVEYGSPELVVKSGFMLGMGESEAEVRAVLQDLREQGVARVTIGQYLQPNRDCLPVFEYVKPARFAFWKQVAKEEYGFSLVESGPLVRSSYMADRTEQENR